MIDYPLNRFTDMAALSDAEQKRLRSLGDTPILYKRAATIRAEGDPAPCIYLMLEGWVLASMVLPSGARQVTKVHLPGDILGTPSMALTSAAETLTALTDCLVAPVPLTRMRDLFVDHPRLAALFLMAVQIERIALMDAMAAMGKTDAREQIITFILDLHDRLARLGKAPGGAFELPMTQEQIGEKLGMTSVHLNRSLRVLDAEGLLTRTGRLVRLNDIETLRGLSQLPRRQLRTDPEWLPESREWGGPARDG